MLVDYIPVVLGLLAIGVSYVLELAADAPRLKTRPLGQLGEGQ